MKTKAEQAVHKTKSKIVKNNIAKVAARGLPIFGLAVLGANAAFYYYRNEQTWAPTYNVAPLEATYFSISKALVYQCFGPIPFLYTCYRGYKVYSTGDFRWILPTIMPGWSTFVKQNPSYCQYN